jgi:outer membrane protein assembly factor BamB
MNRWILFLAVLVLLGGVGAGVYFLFGPGARWHDRPPLGEETPRGDDGTPVAPAQYWPRFRGPDGSGVSSDPNVPTEWSETKNLRWKVALPGPGSSSPIVWDERVFVTCYSGIGQGSSPQGLKRHLLCFNVTDGKRIWEKEVPAVQPEDAYSGYLREHGYASNTPVTDGERVYVFFGKTGVLAFDLDGNQLWQTSVGTSSANRRWGSAASPILYKNTVIVNASEESRSLQALDRKTGKQVWSADARSLELCYGTPLLVSLKDGRHDLVLSKPDEVWGLNPDTGKLLWYARTELGGNISPSVVARDDLIVAFGGFPATGSVAVRAGRGDVTGKIAWSSTKLASYVPSPVIQGDRLYLVNDRGTAYCVEVNTGNVLGEERLPSRGEGASRPIYASTLLVHDKLIAVTRHGGTYVLEASPKLTRLAHNQFAEDDSDFNAAPAVSAGRLFLRSNRFLYCVGTEGH